MKVILKEIDAEIQGSTPIMEVNLDKNPLLARKFQIQTVPTLLLFKKGKLVWKQSGIVPPTTIKQVLKKHA